MAVFISACILFFSACTGALFSPFSNRTRAYAETSIVSEFEHNNVMNDLKGSDIGGKLFDPADYPYSLNAEPSVLLFAEFGYSFKPELQGDYGLYLYIYNPGDIVFDETFNAVELKAGTGTQEKYSLIFLNKSVEVGYEGRFYKFKIDLTLTKKRTILQGLNSSERIYELLGIELNNGGNIKEYKIATKYTYTGYAMGYGSEHMTESTLACKTDGFNRFTELNVKHTVYRPQGDYYFGEQSQLNSCYFRVPAAYFDDYGALEKVLCDWYEYITNPVLVTEVQQLYDLFSAYHGGDISGADLKNDYYLLLEYNFFDTAIWNPSKAEAVGMVTNYTSFKNEYYLLWNGEKLANFINVNDITRINSFSAVFKAGGEAENTSISAEELSDMLWENSLYMGDTSIAGKYSEKLFTDKVDDGHTRGHNRKFISSDDERNVFFNETVKSVWQQWYGGYDVHTTQYDDVKAIITLNESDLIGDDATIAQRLYVNENDIGEIKKEFELAKEHDEKVVLLRYSDSKYFSRTVTDAILPKTTENVDEELLKTNALRLTHNAIGSYLARETVYLNFDIISLWFNLDGVQTEIPVLCSPANVISDIEPPLNQNYHTGGTAANCASGSSCNAPLAITLIIVFVIVAIVLVIVVVKIIFRRPSDKTKVNININMPKDKEKSRAKRQKNGNSKPKPPKKPASSKSKSPQRTKKVKRHDNGYLRHSRRG